MRPFRLALKQPPSTGWLRRIEILEDYTVRDAICEMGFEEAVVFDNPAYDEAIVGVSDGGRAVYDYDRMVQVLIQRDDMEADEASDFVSYNAVRAAPYAGEYAPIIMFPVENPDAEKFFGREE